MTGSSPAVPLAVIISAAVHRLLALEGDFTHSIMLVEPQYTGKPALLEHEIRRRGMHDGRGARGSARGHGLGEVGSRLIVAVSDIGRVERLAHLLRVISHLNGGSSAIHQLAVGF